MKNIALKLFISLMLLCVFAYIAPRFVNFMRSDSKPKKLYFFENRGELYYGRQLINTAELNAYIEEHNLFQQKSIYHDLKTDVFYLVLQDNKPWLQYTEENFVQDYGKNVERELYVFHINKENQQIDMKDFKIFKVMMYEYFENLKIPRARVPIEEVFAINDGKMLIGLKLDNREIYPTKIINLETYETTDIEDTYSILKYAAIKDDMIQDEIPEFILPAMRKSDLYTYEEFTGDKIIYSGGVYYLEDKSFREFPMILDYTAVDNQGKRVIGMNKAHTSVYSIDLETMEVSFLIKRKLCNSVPSMWNAHHPSSMYKLDGDNLYFSKEYMHPMDYLSDFFGGFTYPHRKWYVMNLRTGKKRRIYQPSRLSSIL